MGLMDGGIFAHQNRTRSSLLERLKNPEDRNSWQEFHDLYSRLIYSVARKAGLTESEAEEVQQETEICVFRKIQEFRYDRNAGNFRSWLLHTTRWRIADQFRKRQPQLQPLKNRATVTNRTATIERIPDPNAFNLEAVWDRELEENIFGAAVEKVKRHVSPKQFQIFEMYVLKKRAPGEVARTLRVNTATVYLAKCRVSRLIKNELKNLKSEGR